MTNNRCVTFLLFLFLLAATGVAESSPTMLWPSLSDGPVPVPEGAVFVLRPVKETFLLGEQVLADFIVENQGTEPFEVTYGWDNRAVRALRYQISAVGPDGSPVVDPNPDTRCLGGLGGSASVERGVPHTRRIRLDDYLYFDKPGEYRISASHDCGWTATAERPLPVGTVTITLLEPTTEQAWGVLETMAGSSRDALLSGGKPSHAHEVWQTDTIRYPGFLDPLVLLAEAGHEWAVPGIASIETPASTGYLIDLAEHPVEDVAMRAMDALAKRVQEPCLPKDTELWDWPDTANQWRGVMRERDAAWEDRFIVDVQRVARHQVASDSGARISAAAALLAKVATADDGPLIARALDRACQGHAAASDRDERRTWQSAIRQLCNAAELVMLRGGHAPKHPATTGERILLLQAVRHRDTFRPSDWFRSCEMLLGSEIAEVRIATIHCLPRRLPKALRKPIASIVDRADSKTLSALLGRCGASWLFEAQPTIKRLLSLNRGDGLYGNDHFYVSNAARQLLPRFQFYFLVAEGLTGNLGDPNVSDIERDRLRDLIGLFGERSSLWTSGAYDNPRQVPFYWRAYLHTHRAAIGRGRLLDYKPGKFLGKLFPHETTVEWK